MDTVVFVFTYPVFRGNRMTKKIEISSATAARFIRILQENNILRIQEEPAGRKAGLYVFEPLLELVRV